MMSGGQRLTAVLHRGGNNFDLLRLVAALAVIVGHAYTIAPQLPKVDPVLAVLGFDFSGSLAVKFFFFLSGLLVTDSFRRDPHVVRFGIRRGLRIYPGLLACLLLTAFVAGPLLTSLGVREYVLRPEPRSYVISNLLLVRMQWTLPGVFAGTGLNGSLWTLPFEVLCYVLVAIGGAIGALRSRPLASVLLAGVILVVIASPTRLPIFGWQLETQLLPLCFAAGALVALNKDVIRLGPTGMVILWSAWGLSTLISDAETHRFPFYLAFFYSALYVASLPAVVKLRLPLDASYGVYIYGFLIQQCVQAAWPTLGVHGNQAVSALIAVAMGALSWVAIEKPAIAIGRQLTRAARSAALPPVPRNVNTGV